MKTYTIEKETNNITIHASAKEAESVSGTDRFSSEAALARLGADWPASRLVEIWNSLPGVTPVKKFKDRSTAVSRIWKAIQNLGISSAEPVAPEPEHEVAQAERPGAVIDAIPVAEPEPLTEVVIDSAENTEAPATVAPDPAEVPTQVAAHVPDVAPEAVTPNREATPGEKGPNKRGQGQQHARGQQDGSGDRDA